MKRKHPSAPAHDLQPAATQATSSTFTPIRPQLKTGGSAAGPAVYQVNHSIQPFAVQRASVYYQTEKTTPFIQREPKDKAKQTPLETCMQDPQAILPSNPGKGQGLLFSIDQELVLDAMLGAEGPAITASIRKDPEARRFTCKHGLRGIAALIDTSHGNTFDTAAAEKALRQTPDTYNHAALSDEWRLATKRRQQLEGSAEDLGVWAQRQADTSNHEIPNAAAALNMQDAQRADTDMMINSVQQLQSLASGATALLDSTGEQLGVMDAVFTGLTTMKVADDYPAIVEAQMADLEEQLEYLQPIMERLSFGRANLGEVSKLIKKIIKQCYDARWEAVAYKLKKKTGNRTLQDKIKIIKEGNFKKLLSSYETEAQSLRVLIKYGEPLLFVLRYFKALNDPTAAPPTEADLNKYNAVLNNLNTFAFFTTERGSNLMRRVASFVQQQTAMRLQMQSRTKALPGMVPTLAEAETYFASLNNQTNETVRNAYMEFAQAWFQHRGAASPADLEVYAVEPVFAMPLSIVGARTIVCSGYAQMAAALMLRAGAKKVTFINAVYASLEDILANKVPAGHTVAVVERRGEIFYISNYTATDTEEAAMRPLGNSKDKLYKETGDTHKESLLKMRLALKKDQDEALRKQHK